MNYVLTSQKKLRLNYKEDTVNDPREIAAFYSRWHEKHKYTLWANFKVFNSKVEELQLLP
jgi:hypothetical protein